MAVTLTFFANLKSSTTMTMTRIKTGKFFTLLFRLSLSNLDVKVDVKNVHVDVSQVHY